MLALQQKLDASEIKCLEYTKKWRYAVVCYVSIVFALVLALTFLLQKSIRSLLPRQIIKARHSQQLVVNSCLRESSQMNPDQNVCPSSAPTRVFCLLKL